jgi:hypothetical protein
MSDGSQFPGTLTLTTSDTTGFFAPPQLAVNGSFSLITGRALSSSDDYETYTATITASQNGQSVSMEISI